MKKKIHFVTNKKIEIIDDLFTAKERLTFYNYACNANYMLNRIPHDLPEHRKNQKTLKSTLSLSDIINLGFFSHPYILNYVKENKLRIRKCYINLCTASDSYSYHIDDEEPVSYQVPSGLYYLNLDWDSSWEGETHFADEEMKDIIFSSAFIPGRLVLFDGSIPHKSSQPSMSAPYHRMVLAIKFTNESELTAWNRGISIEDFFYTKDIDLSEREKNAISYIKDKTFFLRHSGQNFFDHLYNTFCLLKSFGLSEDTCLAGLFHSVYGTEFYDPDLKIDEIEIKNIIGERANYLVKCFGETNRLEKIMSNYFNLSLTDDLDLTYILYANQIEQAYRINVGDFSLYANIKNKIEYLKNIKK